MKFPNKVYNILKWMCIIAMPSLTVFLNVVLPIFGLSVTTTQNVVTVVGATATLIGGLIGISNVNYNKKKDGE